MENATVHAAIGRLEGKMDGVAKRQDELKEYVVSVSARTGKLERWQSWLTGATAVVMILFGILARVAL